VDKATLVGKREQEIQGALLYALHRAEIPVTFLDWDFVPQLDELQLVVATPLFDTAGPREANDRVLKALMRTGVYQKMPIRKLVVKSPKDPTVKMLEQEALLRAEGDIHIVANPTANTISYFIMFTPYVSGGGSVRARSVNGDVALREFLEEQLEIFPEHVSSAVARLSHRGNATVPHVQLTLKKARRLGLV